MGISFTGNIRIIERDEFGNLHERHAQNTMTSGGLALIASYLGAWSNRWLNASVDRRHPLQSAISPRPPHYLVYGSGTVPVGRFMTSVPGETYRTANLDSITDGASVTFHGYLGDTENASQTIGCYGLVGGVANAQPGNAGSDPNYNEILVAVANEPTPFGKGTASTVSIDWVITVSGVI